MGHACRYSFGSLLLAAQDILIAQHLHPVGVYSMYLDIIVKMRCTFSFAITMVFIFYFPVCTCCAYSILQSSSVCVVVVMVVVVVVFLLLFILLILLFLLFSSSQNIPLSGFPVHTQHLVSNPSQLWVGIPVEPSKAAQDQINLVEHVGIKSQK